MKRLLMIFLLIAACAHAAEGTKVLVVGFDGMDPLLLQKFRDEGVMPNFDKFVADGGEMKPLGTSTPPQSPVAWSNFITGLNPGGHGIFDFTQKKSDEYRLHFINSTNREGASIFGRVSQAGGSALVLGLPATHPPDRKSVV